MTAIDASANAPVESAAKAPITVAYGDGIGPEIMAAALRVLEAAGARLEPEVIEVGEQVYLRGITSGIEPAAWDSLRRTKVFLKAPITTPQGGGYKSLNVTMRKSLGLYANVRPCVSYHPFIHTKHPNMDVVIVRENEEDTYGGIEHQQTNEVTQCLKLITGPGCEKIIRYAFSYAYRNKRRKVTCFTKDNIMKITDGLFSRIFHEVAEEYPDIEADHKIIDIGTARLADAPEQFDVIVTPNLYGDIISDVAAEIAGSVGLAGSANIGDSCAMFEAIHGSAPDIAGKDIANPSGLIQAGVMMLVHLGQTKVAETVQNAWLRTIEEGVHTAEIHNKEFSDAPVGTTEFADAVIDHLGKVPEKFHPVIYASRTPHHEHNLDLKARARAKKELVGVDLFVDWDEADRNPDALAKKLESLNADGLKLKMITNRGVKVWPEGMPETFCTDHWRCRYTTTEQGGAVTHQQVIALQQRAAEAGVDFIKTEHLCTFDGKPGYSLGQGE